MDEHRPSWQLDACPGWCAGGHQEGDHPDDRVHRSSDLAVPVVARRTWFEGGGIRRAAQSTAFEVGLGRVDGEPQTWVYVGDGPGRSFEVTHESAERLAARIEAVLRRTG